MRKFFVIAMALMVLLGGGIAGVANAATWHTANQITFAWDAVTSDVDGDPIPAGFSVVYDTFVVAHNSGDFDADKMQQTVGGASIAETITLTKGHWYLGVRAALVDDLDGVRLYESAISWSSDPTVCLNGVDFGGRYWVNPNKPADLNKP